MNQYRNLNKSFEVLNLDTNASIEDIKKAYHKLAKIYHPDKISDVNDKKEAEKKFNDIKNAYDMLMDYHKNGNSYVYDDNLKYPEHEEFNNHFSNFFKAENNKEEDKEQDTTKTTREQYVSDFEKYVKNKKFSQYDIYMCVYHENNIYRDQLGYHATDMLFKENLYHTYIKTTHDYMMFEKNYHYVKNLDIDVVLYYDSQFDNKPLNFNLSYEQKSLCSACRGWGCHRCDDGIIVKSKKLNVKIDKCVDQKNVVLKIKGNQSPWKSGNINIKLVKKQNLTKDHQPIPCYYKIKNKRLPILNQATKYYEQSLEMIKTIWNFLLQHKTHTIYLGVITILVIIIIVLACVL